MKDLATLRVEIDEIDQQLMALFEKRMEVVEDVVLYKKANHLPIFQPEREVIVIEKNVARLANKDLEEYARIWLQTMMDQSKKYQTTLLEKMDK